MGFFCLFFSCIREKWEYKLTVRMLAGLLLLFACLVFLISVSGMEQQQQPLSLTRDLKTVVAEHQRLEYEKD